VITSLLVAVLAVVYRYLSIWENKKRDKGGIMEAYEHAYVRRSLHSPDKALLTLDVSVGR